MQKIVAGRTPTQRPATRAAHGISMIEALCVCTITATALGVSAGSLRDFVSTQRLQSAAAEVESEVQLARSSAAQRGHTVRLAIQPIAGGSCTLLHTGPRNACACGDDGAPTCAGDAEVLHLNRQPVRYGVRITTTDVSIAFSAANGTATPTATIKIADDRGHALHQIVNVLGRTRTCTPGAGLPGYRHC
jgi:type IV fimbrial biogenesis protein FimT